ncbi:isochorismatase family protein [Micromonospora sp. NPDC048830]|uniref:isochorismatase family protein n=1 Tax=Micromonospora sp. NPDC048830 TaxID=3364257 RepID=UPI0037107718
MILDYSGAAELYDRQGIGRTMGLGKRPAVLVVDFTEGFTSPESPMGVDMSDSVKATRRLLDVARSYRLPVVYTVNGYRDDLLDAGVWPQKFPSLKTLVLGSRWTRIDERITPEAEDLILEKQYPSAFFGTTLASALAARGVDSLILTGTTTSGCIRMTAVDALQHGYRTYIPEECVCDRHEAPHRANLFDLGSKYVDVGTLDALLDQWRENPPRFE